MKRIKLEHVLVLLIFILVGFGVYINVQEQLSIDQSKLPEKVEEHKGFQRWITNLKNKGLDFVDADEFTLIEENEIYNTRWMQVYSLDEKGRQEEFDQTIIAHQNIDNVIFSPSERLFIDYRNIKRGDYKANDIRVKILNDKKFFTIQLAKVDAKTQELFLNSKELAPYKHYLEILFRNAKYTLSEEEEKILNLFYKSAFTDWYKMVSDFLSSAELEIINEKGKAVKKTLEETLTIAFTHKNKDVRASSSMAVKQLLEDNVNVAERELNAILYTKKVVDELRGYEKPNFSRLNSDDIDPDVVSTMAGVITNNFKISRDYYKFKAQLFGMDKLQYFDRGLEYGEVDREYSFDEAIELIEETFRSVDEEFGSFVSQYVENGRFDVLPRKGKRGGAFCIHNNKTLPVYILLNHTNKLRDVSTIAHEMGHAINNELMMRQQNALNSKTTLATAEVSSTFFESLIQERLLTNLKGKEKLSLLIGSIDRDVSTIIRQTACYNFELELHQQFREKGFLSKETIGNIFINHMEAYMGDYVDQSEVGNLYWVDWSHIRRFFYVYSYSNGMLIAKALKEKYDKDKGFVEDIKTFLSAGMSKSPKDIFSEIGVDITTDEFWSEGILNLKERIESAKKLAKSLGELD